MSLSAKVVEDIRLRIPQVMLWFDSHGGDLRTPGLKPGVYPPISLTISEAVERISSIRATALGPQPPALPGDVQGRLLVTEIDGSFGDSPSAIITNGIIDEDDLPPWDTWLRAYSEELDSGINFVVLLSWIPQELVEAVDKAVQEDPTECVQWASECPFSATRNILGHLPQDWRI